MTGQKRIGILGGTFNPPHYAHLAMAKAALQEGGLDEVRWLPNGDPPHKMPEVSTKDRHGMTEQMTAGEAGMSVSDRESRRLQRSYMAETLEELAAEEGDCRLYLICGSDTLTGMPSWYRADRIFKLADIMVLQRPGVPLTEAALAFLRNRGARVMVLSAKLPDITSTGLRQLFRLGQGNPGEKAVQTLLTQASKMTKPAVASYIIERGLYRPA